MTGVYVLMGLYSGHGPQEQLEGIRVEPRLSEDLVSRLMKEIAPEGFGRIPPFIGDPAAAEYGKIAGYCAYEVPQNHLNLVKNPWVLTLSPESA